MLWGRIHSLCLWAVPCSQMFVLRHDDVAGSMAVPSTRGLHVVQGSGRLFSLLKHGRLLVRLLVGSLPIFPNFPRQSAMRPHLGSFFSCTFSLSVISVNHMTTTPVS